MEIAHDKQGAAQVIRLTGRLDAASATQLKDQVKHLLGAGDKALVIDLSQVTFMDSSGLGSLVACLRSANQSSGDVKLAALTPEICNIVELTRLHRLFQIFDSVDEAVKSY